MRTELWKGAATVFAALALALPAAAQAPEVAVDGARVEVRRVEGDQMTFNASRTVAADEVVDGDVLVMNGTLRVEGRVEGDVTVANGDLVLAQGAVVEGDAIVSGGKLVNQGGRVEGELRAVGQGSVRMRNAGSGAQAQIRMERGWFAPIGEGITGLFQTLALGLLMAGIGAAVVFYANPQLGRVSEAVRSDAVRAGLLGFAANILALPLWIALIALLCLTVVGIPLAIVAFFLYWPALAAAAGYGVAAVAHAVGERTAERQGSLQPYARNSYTYVFTGVAILLLPMAAAQLLKMTGFLGFVGSMVNGIAWLLLWGAASLGLGALLLTRAGTRPVLWFRAGRGGGNDPLDDALFDFDRTGRTA